MKTIYQYIVDATPTETLVIRVDLMAIVAIEAPRKEAPNHFHVYAIGISRPIPFPYVTEAAYQGLINAWERLNQHTHSTDLKGAH